MDEYYESAERINRMRQNSLDNGKCKFLRRLFTKKRTRMDKVMKMKEVVTAWEHRLRYISRVSIPLTIISTAVIYLKRFYIGNSTKNYDIEVIAPTCLYMAFNKEQEIPVKLDSFASQLRLSLRQRAKFQSAVECDLIDRQIADKLQLKLKAAKPKHPFAFVDRFMSEIKLKLNCWPTDLDDLKPSIVHFLHRVYHTDAVVIYLPAQIALAAFADAVHSFDINHVDYITFNYIYYLLVKDLKNWEDGISNKLDNVIADIRRIVHDVAQP